MAGNARFHNKYHGANHHTVPTDGVVDSALDPIASHDYPFKGDLVVNGLLSASNILTKVYSGNLDTIPYYSEIPTGWHVLRDSTFIDGDLTITGNVSATGKLTYFDTQVHVTSATEINIAANNTNGKDVAFLVNQMGTNDVAHFKDSDRSALLITGDTTNPGWVGINLNGISQSTPSQRVTIVGSVSTVPDPSGNDGDQINGQADPGISGSHYIEGQLHVNDKTFLDQTYIDTTDGNLVVSGANTIDVDIPSDFEEHVTMDQVTIDTSDGNFLVNGTETIHLSGLSGTEIHNFLDVHADDLNGAKGGVKIKSALMQNTLAGNKFHIENTFVHLDGHRHFHGGDTVIDIGEAAFGVTLSGNGGILFDFTGFHPGNDWEELGAFTVKGQTYLTDTWIDTSANLGNNAHKRFVVGPRPVSNTVLRNTYHAMFNTGVQFSSGALFEDYTEFNAPGKVFDFTYGEKVNSDILVHFNNDLIMTGSTKTLSAHGYVDIDNDTRIGDGRDKTLTVTAEVDSNVLPRGNTLNLGEADEGHHWGDVFSIRGLFSDHVGINTHDPNKELTVIGETSATGHVRFDTSLDVDGLTTLDRTHINTTDGALVVSGENPGTFKIGVDGDNRVNVFQSGDWKIENGDLYLEHKLIHLNDENTFIKFDIDQVEHHAGGKKIFTVSQDYESFADPGRLTIGDPDERVDVYTEENTTIFVEGLLSAQEGWFESLTAQDFTTITELSSYGNTDIVDGDLTINDGPAADTTGSIYLCAGNMYVNPGSTIDGRDISVDGSTLDSVYTSTNTYSGDWDSVYSWVNSDSGTNNTTYNSATFVDVAGDTMTGDLVVPNLTTTSDVHIGGNLNVVGTAVISGGNVQLGDAATDNVIFGADVDSNIIPDDDNTYDLGSTGQKWQDVHTVNVKATGDVEWSGGDSSDANSVYTSVCATSGEWNTAYTWVETHGATSTETHNDGRYVNIDGDTMTNALNVPVVSAQSLSADNLTLSNNSLHFEGGGAIKGDSNGNILIDSGILRVTTLSALSSYIDVIDIKVRELSGYDIIDGDMSVSGGLSADGGNSIDWNAAVSTLDTKEGLWDATKSTVDTNSTGWDTTKTTVDDNEDSWTSVYTQVGSLSDTWSTPSDTIVMNSSGNWDRAYTTYSTTSGNYFDTTTNQIDGTLTVTGGVSAFSGGVSAANMTVYELRGRPKAIYRSGAQSSSDVQFTVEGLGVDATDGIDYSVYNGSYFLSAGDGGNAGGTSSDHSREEGHHPSIQTVTLEAAAVGTDGNTITLTGNGDKTIDTLVSEWNGDPANSGNLINTSTVGGSYLLYSGSMTDSEGTAFTTPFTITLAGGDVSTKASFSGPVWTKKGTGGNARAYLTVQNNYGWNTTSYPVTGDGTTDLGTLLLNKYGPSGTGHITGTGSGHRQLSSGANSSLAHIIPDDWRYTIKCKVPDPSKPGYSGWSNDIHLNTNGEPRGNVYVHENFSNLNHTSSGVCLVKGHTMMGNLNINGKPMSREWMFLQMKDTSLSLPVPGTGINATDGIQYSSLAVQGWSGAHSIWGLKIGNYGGFAYKEIGDYLYDQYGIPKSTGNSYPSGSEDTQTLLGLRNAALRSPFNFSKDNSTAPTNTLGMNGYDFTQMASRMIGDLNGDPSQYTQFGGPKTSGSGHGAHIPLNNYNSQHPLSGTSSDFVNSPKGTIGDLLIKDHPEFRIIEDTISHYEDDILLTPYTKLDGRDISVDGTYVDAVCSKQDDWDSVYTNVQSNSSTWEVAGDINTLFPAHSGDWETASDDSIDNKASLANVASVSSNWDNVYTDMSTNSGDWLYKERDQTYSGDLLTLTNKLSAGVVWVRSLTAEDATYLSVASGLTMPQGENIYLRNGTIFAQGNIEVYDGNLKVEDDIVHLHDENTLMRFEHDKITFRCHDIVFFTINEETDPSSRDYVTVGNTVDEIDFRVKCTLEPFDAFTVDGSSGDAALNHNVSLGGDSADTVTFNADVNSNIIPDAPVTGPSNVTDHSLGTASQGWSALYVKDLHFRDTVNKNSSTAPLTATGEYIVVTVDGVERAIRLWDF